MASLPEPINALAAALSRLPGIGPRSAERLALHVAQTDPSGVRTLAQTLIQAIEKVRSCSICGGLTEADPCGLCADPRRDATLLCVVERAVDIIRIDKGGGYMGKFHVLGGKISPINAIGPEDLRFQELLDRLSREPIREVIIALPSDVEGDATSHYLAQQLSRPGLKVSRIAHGLPVGSGLEFADELTLTRAIEGRQAMQ